MLRGLWGEEVARTSLTSGKGTVRSSSYAQVYQEPRWREGNEVLRFMAAECTEGVIC